jgi:hypothetical protein
MQALQPGVMKCQHILQEMMPQQRTCLRKNDALHPRS